MTKIQHIERSVETLSDVEFAKFSEWFEKLRARRWEDRIRADAEAGKLDALANEALADFHAGRTRPL